jgi:hypothetical protein
MVLMPELKKIHLGNLASEMYIEPDKSDLAVGVDLDLHVSCRNGKHWQYRVFCWKTLVRFYEETLEL